MEQQLKQEILTPLVELKRGLKLKISPSGSLDFEATNYDSDVADALLLTATTQAKARQSAITEQIDTSYKVILTLAGVVGFVFLSLSSFYITLKIKESLRSNNNVRIEHAV